MSTLLYGAVSLWAASVLVRVFIYITAADTAADPWWTPDEVSKVVDRLHTLSDTLTAPERFVLNLPALVRRRWRARARRTAERQALAAVLHNSNAWHCGCWFHRLERTQLHGDVPRPAGIVLSRRSFFGVPVETVQLSEDERARLRR